MFNPIRIDYITSKIKNHFKIEKDNPIFLKNLQILDIGCGGGLISEPMARLVLQLQGLMLLKRTLKLQKYMQKKVI